MMLMVLSLCVVVMVPSCELALFLLVGLIVWHRDCVVVVVAG